MNRLVSIAIAALACTRLLGAAEAVRTGADRSCAGTADTKVQASSSDEIRFPIAGRQRFIMRRLPGPEGAIDFRILGERGAPALLSLIGADPDRYADYTYNGSHADVDVSHGGLNLRPLDGSGSVNVWSMLGNTRLRVGSEESGRAGGALHAEKLDGTHALLRRRRS